MVMEIPLTKGYVALVDDEDYEELSQWKWQSQSGGERNTAYARRGIYNPYSRRMTTVMMHRVIMGDPADYLIDHKDGNGLNNTRSNLRIATRAENQYNSRINKNNTTGFKGVTFHRNTGKYMAQVSVDGATRYLGLYNSAEAAHYAYCEAAKQLHSEFANTGEVPCPV